MTAAKSARILSPTRENLELCGQHLSQGLVVGMPTETVYGLAGDAFNEEALTRIFSTKERPTFDPLIVHVGRFPSDMSPLAGLESLELIDLSKFSELAKKRAEALLKEYWPGPLTLVLPKNSEVPDLVTSGLSTVALRMPRHPVAQGLIAEAGTPLAAPSANRFGKISPTSAQDVMAELGDRIDYILDGGTCEIGLESTVVAVDATGQLTLLRPGGITTAELEETTGAPVAVASATSKNIAPAAPGMLASHYAPTKRLTLLDRSFSTSLSKLKNEAAQGGIGILLMSGDPKAALEQFDLAIRPKVRILSLSDRGDLSEIARALFSGLRSLDDMPDVQKIFCEAPPTEVGLGHAIADRLKRASA